MSLWTSWMASMRCRLVSLGICAVNWVAVEGMEWSGWNDLLVASGECCVGTLVVKMVVG